MGRLSTFNVWQVEGAGGILPHHSNIFGLRAGDLVDEQSLLWMRVELSGNGDDANFALLANLRLNGRTRTMTAFGRLAGIRVRFVLSSHVKFQTETRPALAGRAPGLL